MKLSRLLVIGGLAAALPAWAVYAPIPEQDQGKDLTFAVKGAFTFDTNIFGAASNETESSIWEFAPRIAYNHSLSEQTFFAASYGLTLDYFDNRPGTKLLDSHELTLRLAHQFSKGTTFDVNDAFTITKNPESLLPGIATPLATDQSFDRNELDGRFDTELTGKIGLSAKARSIYYKYRNAALGRSLDRIENLYGLSGDYAILPEFKGVAEYRHEDVYYRKVGETKNKSSDFAMAGFDYAAAKKLTLTGRFGYEWRARSSERSASTPYLEGSAKYDYAEGSYLAAGYTYTFEESSDVVRFTDSKVHRLFLNAQHRVTALIVASASLIYEYAQLQARRALSATQPDLNEDTVRVGFALTYQPTQHWSLSANVDLDNTNSDDPVRDLKRQRYGLSATYSF